MRVKCVICDKIEKLDNELPLAKKLRNRPIHTYMCEPCKDRIEVKTQARQATGKFRKHHTEETEDEYI
ncbi:YlaI family protein [Paenalkalicoccus suaedae]|uniref:YlaI family protein n=1 Tax=Paenalkalicoccus suaedae TaxID=2592382 RepID=A0A859FFW2_9BACI|nr:YlaI family protein [Paenalkalicoccus suaedae]QKS71562.1 YlaI family protein [Paenalkalicoccus suaedae]